MAVLSLWCKDVCLAATMGKILVAVFFFFLLKSFQCSVSAPNRYHAMCCLQLIHATNVLAHVSVSCSSAMICCLFVCLFISSVLFCDAATKSMFGVQIRT